MKNPLSREILSGFRALGGTRTPNLLIRSQMLYPLSHERWKTSFYGFQAHLVIGREWSHSCSVPLYWVVVDYLASQRIESGG